MSSNDPTIAAPSASTTSTAVVATTTEPPVTADLATVLRRAASDTWLSMRRLAADPTGGLSSAYQLLAGEPRRALHTGIGLAVAASLLATLGSTISMSSLSAQLGARVADVNVGFVSTLLGCATPAASLIAVLLAIGWAMRAATGAATSVSNHPAAAVFVGGATALPYGFASVIAPVLGVANIEVLVVLILLALVCTIVLLHAGMISVMRFSSRAAFWFTPLVLGLTTWLCKIMIVMFFA